MKALRFAMFVLAVSVPSLVSAQTHEHKAPEQAAPSEAHKAFDHLKKLAGSWVGQLTMEGQPSEFTGKFAEFSLRVTSRGNAMVHEMSISGLPDHPVTIFYLDGDRLTLTHYCDAGNRPRMIGTLSPDGKRLEFEFLDLSGGNERGHMHRTAFTFIDGDRHTEEWTYMMPGDKPARVRFDLQRTHGGVASGQ